MRKSTKPIPEADRSKPKKRRDMPQSTGNKRLAEQIRKILARLGFGAAGDIAKSPSGDFIKDCIAFAT